MLKARQAVQAEIEDRLRLDGREMVFAVDETKAVFKIVRPRVRSAGTFEHIRDRTRRPTACHEAFFGLCGRR